GKENVKQFLLENPKLEDEIDRKLREKLGIYDGDVEESEQEETQTLFDE
ncbi:DNA recombination/repair protein RecA, partial [Staphylococcus pseudintermedius]